jgi:hypothetical protein
VARARPACIAPAGLASNVSAQTRSAIVNRIIWLVGAVAIILFVMSYFGLR